MIIAVVGSRAYADTERVKRYVRALYAMGHTVCSGGSGSVDKAAHEAAAELGQPFFELLADWSVGRRAGPERNSRVVAVAEGMAAYWDGKSRGTLDAVTKAAAKGIEVRLNPQERPQW